MEVQIQEGTITQGGVWITFEGKIDIDGVKWHASAEGDESLRGIIWELVCMEADQKITVGPGHDLNEVLEELLMENLDSLSIMGGEVLKYDPDIHESQVLTIRAGRVVAGHNVPYIGSEADTFGPAWAR